MDLSQPQALRAFLLKFGIDARKGLGQHFLCSSSVVKKISEALDGVQGVLEIGPGPGALTSMLCDQCQAVSAIELDERMIEALQESAPCATVFRENALESDLSAKLAQLPQPRAVVSNLPYYITGPLVTRIAEAKAQFDIAVLMMQKEVGLRVLAQPKSSERGSLSVFLQVQFEIKKVADAPAGAFLPPPKVDSIVLSFRPKPPEYGASLEAGLFRLIRFGFKQPRKTLLNNLIAGANVERLSAESWIKRLELPLTVRPQELTNQEWIRLAELAP